jgi:hypothetical protein
MTSYRLDRFKNGKRVKSYFVDGLDDDDMAVKLVLADCTSGHCKLYRDDKVVAEMDGGVWSLPVTPHKTRAANLTSLLRKQGTIA